MQIFNENKLKYFNKKSFGNKKRIIIFALY